MVTSLRSLGQFLQGYASAMSKPDEEGSGLFNVDVVVCSCILGRGRYGRLYESKANDVLGQFLRSIDCVPFTMFMFHWVEGPARLTIGFTIRSTCTSVYVL